MRLCPTLVRLIFCRDMGASLKKVDDCALLSFASWRKKQPEALPEAVPEANRI